VPIPAWLYHPLELFIVGVGCLQNRACWRLRVTSAFRSGLLNFCSVSLALHKLGYKALGIQIDSGDLAYLSNKARETFEKVAEV